MKAKFSYVGIRVKDLQRSIDFYTELLGMKVIGGGKIEQTKGETISLGSERGGFVLELNYYEEDSLYSTEYTVGEGLDHLAFKVEDLNKALEEARLAGYRTILEIKADGGRWAYIEDPNGIWIELYQAFDPKKNSLASSMVQIVHILRQVDRIWIAERTWQLKASEPERYG